MSLRGGLAGPWQVAGRSMGCGRYFTPMKVDFGPYVLGELEQELTVRHPELGWPVWTPVLGIRAWFKFQDPVPFWRSLAPVYQRFHHAFRDQLSWQMGLASKRRSKLRPTASIPPLPSENTTDWEIDLCGPGEEKLQSFRCSFRTAGGRDPAGQVRAHVLIALPLDTLSERPSTVHELIECMCSIESLAAGFAGVCGAGTPDYQSTWREPEFYLLSTYLGIHPSEDTRLDILPLGEEDGYCHAGQWMTLLGREAVDRLGGLHGALARATELGLAADQVGRTLRVRAGDLPDIGFRHVPRLYQAADAFLGPNKADSCFIGHGFNALGHEALGVDVRLPADLWLNRMNATSIWSSTADRWSGMEISLTRSGGPDIIPLANT